MGQVDFYIIGWPKTGSTSLHHYIAQHPDIYMSSVKESYYHCTDIIRESDKIGAGKHFLYRDEEQYSKLFSSYNNEKLKGESSVFYVISKEAILNINKNNPSAKLVILLRDPVELVTSWFHHLKQHSREDASDVFKALNLQESRLDYKNLPPNTHTPIHVQYDEIINFPKHLKNIYNTFNKDQVCILLYDDLKKSEEETTKKVFDFLNVDTAFNPVFVKKNLSKKVKNQKLKKAIDKRKQGVVNVLTYLGLLKENSFLHRIYLNAFTENKRRDAIKDTQQEDLRKRFTNMVKETSDLIEVDLIKKWNY